MCNFYDHHRNPIESQRRFDFVGPLPNLESRYVVRPPSIERVAALGKDGARYFQPMRWGLVPPWAKDVSPDLGGYR